MKNLEAQVGHRLISESIFYFLYQLPFKGTDLMFLRADY
jgi:hypothetical protein